MRRTIILILALLAVTQLWAAEKEKGQFDLLLNGVNKGYDRFKVEVRPKDGLLNYSSEVHFQLPVPKAKRGYVDLLLYPKLDTELSSGKFAGYDYRMTFNDYSEKDMVEAQDSATEYIDQDMRNYDLMNRTQQSMQDESEDRIDLGVNAGKCLVRGNTLHFVQTRFSDTRVKDEPLPSDMVLVDAYCFGLYIPIAQRALAMKSEGEDVAIAFPQILRLKKGRLEFMGIEKTPFHGEMTILKHFDLSVDGTILSSFWTDKKNQLVLVSVPSEGLLAIRAKYKPVPFEVEQPRLAKQIVVATGAFTEKNVRVDSAGTVLGASLTLPQGAGPFPTVLLIQDFQFLDRDGNDPANPYSRAGTWKQLAYQLATDGFASLRWDSRGLGESGGSSEKMTWADRRADIRALELWLKDQPSTAGGKVILLSLGLGGWAAAQEADQPPVSALVAIAYPAKPLARLWKEQVNTINDPDARLKASQELDQMADSMQDKTKEWATFGGRKIFLAQAREMWQVDPTAMAAAVTVPCLFAYPERDTTILPFHRDVLSGSLHAGQETAVLTGIGHRLTGVDDNGNSNGLVDGKALAPVVQWLKKVAAEKKP